ncbi:MAG: YciK family oxidoreductase [Woeseiaceae bacterium]|nr:YciK family oxidoreductase [Woeseiaceae bacterium]
MDHRNYQYGDDLLAGRIILVTGASDGIGRALALEIARVGGRVVLHGRNARKLEKVYDVIEAIPGAARPSIAVMDLASADSAAYTTLADSIGDEMGHLDGLVHNASILGSRQPIEHYDAAEWQKVMHVNVTAAFALTQVFLPWLRAAEDASVIFTSSGVGRQGRAFWGAYAVSKFATEGLSQVLAAEHEHTSLRVNCVNPGPTRTAMRLAAYPAENRDALKTPGQVLAPYLYLLGARESGRDRPEPGFAISGVSGS